jgi:hypothetical protein
LFLLMVVLLVRRVKKILLLVSAFTVAHSVTLVLAALQILTLSPRVVEPLIALSIAYMAARNVMSLWKRAYGQTDARGAERLGVTAGFGLVHGLGFAGALAEVQIPQNFFVPAILWFNLGVEVGQLGILLVLVPLLWWIDRLKHRRGILLGISGVTMLVGVALAIIRVWLH